MIYSDEKTKNYLNEKMEKSFESFKNTLIDKNGFLDIDGFKTLCLELNNLDDENKTTKFRDDLVALLRIAFNEGAKLGGTEDDSLLLQLLEEKDSEK